MTWKRHNEISDLMVKCLKWLGTFSLYLICVYWATEAVIKYLDEPSSTAIQYSFGEDGKVPNFPAITFCDPELTYPNSLVSECGIKLGNMLVRIKYVCLYSFGFVAMNVVSQFDSL